MALRNILHEGDETLKKTSREVGEITDRIRTLISDMWETMYQANGLGLAAPQVGVLRRVVVVDASEPEESEEPEQSEGTAEPDGSSAARQTDEIESGGGNGGTDTASADEPPKQMKYTLINPEILWRSEETVTAKEGCLSVPGYVGTVERPVSVRVRAMDENGEIFEVEAEGLLARAFCHEIDHLNGILYPAIALDMEKTETGEE